MAFDRARSPSVEAEQEPQSSLVSFTHDILSSAWRAGVQNPVTSVAQLAGADVAAAPVDKHADKLAVTMGTAVGELADLAILHRSVGGIVDRAAVSGYVDQTLSAKLIDAVGKSHINADGLKSGSTGFLYGSVLTPTENGETSWSRLARGVSLGGAFGAMSGAETFLKDKSFTGIVGSASSRISLDNMEWPGKLSKSLSLDKSLLLDKGVDFLGKTSDSLGLNRVSEAVARNVSEIKSTDVDAVARVMAVGAVGGAVNENLKAWTQGDSASIADTTQGALSWAFGNTVMKGVTGDLLKGSDKEASNIARSGDVPSVNMPPGSAGAINAARVGDVTGAADGATARAPKLGDTVRSITDAETAKAERGANGDSLKSFASAVSLEVSAQPPGRSAGPGLEDSKGKVNRNKDERTNSSGSQPDVVANASSTEFGAARPEATNHGQAKSAEGKLNEGVDVQTAERADSEATHIVAVPPESHG